MSHTTEPWYVFPLHPDRFSIGAYRCGSLCIKVSDSSPKEVITANGDESLTEEEAKANAHRIVACVNALAGIDNPQEFVDRANYLVKSYSEANMMLADLMKLLTKATLYLPTASFEFLKADIQNDVDRVEQITKQAQTKFDSEPMPVTEVPFEEEFEQEMSLHYQIKFLEDMLKNDSPKHVLMMLGVIKKNLEAQLI